MIYKNKYGSVNFWDEYPELNEKHNDLFINFSGGTDSTLIVWMLCEKFKQLGKDTQINFSTLVDTDRPNNEWVTREIILWFKERYDLNWGEHYVGRYTRGSIDGRMDKVFYHGLHTKKIRREHGFTLLVHGRTANPPANIREEFDLNRGREEVRDVPDVSEKLIGNRRQSYRPLLEVHKGYVAEVFRKYELMELFNLTSSCIGNAAATEYFTTPCKHCWWCKEKLWAFGCYDNSHV